MLGNIEINKERKNVTENELLVPLEQIERSILFIRGKKVMLDSDLAGLYEVETKALKQAVKRNINRFPQDFMFELTADEFKVLRSQFVTSGSSGGQRYTPFAFTEQGIAMLSGILNSPRAVAVNIAIMRAFVQMRRMIDGNRELAEKITDLEAKYSDHDEKIQLVFNAIRELMTPVENTKQPIGFK